MGKDDAEDLLTILSMIHRRLDAAKNYNNIPEIHLFDDYLHSYYI